MTDLKNDKTDEKVQLSKDLTSQKKDLEDKEGKEEDAQDDLEDYGNCAQKIDVYNNAMLAKQTDIDAIEEVIQFLQTISSDTDDHVSLVQGNGVDDVDLDLAHYK